MVNDKYFVLVNKNNPIIDEDMFETVEYKNALGEVIVVEKETLAAFLNMREDMLKLGINVDLDSGYRSIARQRELEKEFLATKGEEYTLKYVAKPGYSEHHTGLAIDIILIKDGKALDDSLTFDNSDIKFVQENAYKYGFILRYPLGKEKITGYNYEPWHFRYIKDIDIAKYIFDKNICFEEYLDKQL